MAKGRERGGVTRAGESVHFAEAEQHVERSSYDQALTEYLARFGGKGKKRGGSG